MFCPSSQPYTASKLSQLSLYFISLHNNYDDAMIIVIVDSIEIFGP